MGNALDAIITKEFQIVARLMERVNSPHFPTCLRRALRARLPICTFLIINFASHRPPISLYHWIPNHDLNEIYLNQYLSGAYQLDPYYQHSLGAFRTGLHRLVDIAPDRYFSSQYYQLYYSATKLTDEMGVLVPLSDGSVTHLSFGRDASAKQFSRRELRELKKFAPILTELVRQYSQAMINSYPKPQIKFKNRDPLDKVIFDYTAKNCARGLTKREAEITALVLQGHSSLSASLMLDISVETVKVHRKNIYRKLEISTQAELFVKLSDALASTK